MRPPTKPGLNVPGTRPRTRQWKPSKTIIQFLYMHICAQRVRKENDDDDDDDDDDDNRNRQEDKC